MPDVTHLRNDERKDLTSDLDEIAREGARGIPFLLLSEPGTLS